MRLRIFLSAATLALATVGAVAAEPAYIDDRSDAAALVRSLYNAIGRKEYGRAWSYFGDEKPAASLAAFSDGYADTTDVTVIIGGVAAEGTAGTTYFSVPVAILAFKTDGSDQVYAGCYTARLTNPVVQGSEFRPLTIEKGSLAATDEQYENALPASCPGAPPPEPVDTALEQARTAFHAGHGECDRHLPGADPSATQADTYVIPFNYRSDTQDQTKREMRLFRFFCSAGAYNEQHLYYLYDEADGLRELHFAVPDLDIRYVDDNTDGDVESIGIIGYQAKGKLVNSSYDEASQSISEASQWRGIGDASSAATWIFRDGDFTLVSYEVDPTFDNEINPQIVVDLATAP